MHVTTYYKENAGETRAEIHQVAEGYRLKCYNHNGMEVANTLYEDKAISAMSELADNWIQNYRVLKG